MEQSKIKELVAQMTIEEKASFCVGKDFWHGQRRPFGAGLEQSGHLFPGRMCDGFLV